MSFLYQAERFTTFLTELAEESDWRVVGLLRFINRVFRVMNRRTLSEYKSLPEE